MLVSIDELRKSYTGNLKWLFDNTLFVCLSGSHAYGTNIEGSDIDFRGVSIAPRSYHSGFMKNFEQANGKVWGTYDGTLYSLQKFCGLAVDGNPGLAEILFVDPSDRIFIHSLWEELYEHRDLFISKLMKHRYSGYAVSQLRKVDLHRQHLLNPPKKKPEREDFDLPSHPQVPKEQRMALEAVMLKQVEAWRVDFNMVDYANRIDLMNHIAEAMADMGLNLENQYIAAGNKIGLDSNATEYLKKERQFKNSIVEWDKYQAWKESRNPIRAAMEEKFGYDSKMAAHGIRLQIQCKEILDGKGVIVKRPDADLFKAIRKGAWSYERFREETIRLETENEVAFETTKIAEQPDRVKIDEICQGIVEKMWQ